MVDPSRFELLTSAMSRQRSNQLSYGSRTNYFKRGRFKGNKLKAKKKEARPPFFEKR